ncbi:MAG TPA: cytochrome c1 [Magnetospirillaceae bacterium]|jgi:cytochrome c1
MRKQLLAAAFAAALGLGFAGTGPAMADDEIKLVHQDWPWLGIFGHYDVAQLKRGFQVYHDVCSNCHSLKLVAYRNLGGGGAGTTGLGYSDDDVKKFAAEKQVPDEPNDAGDVKPRPARPSDRFVSPFPNDNAARAANNGALPPDLSLIVKAREGGPDYVYAILTGFVDPAPADFKLNPGMHYNKAFAGHQIGMPPPLADNVVTYTDGTKATLDQEAHDIVAFLNWAAEPELDVRHNLGIKVLIFAGILTILAYVLKRQIWSDVPH